MNDDYWKHVVSLAHRAFEPYLVGIRMVEGQIEFPVGSDNRLKGIAKIKQITRGVFPCARSSPQYVIR